MPVAFAHVNLDEKGRVIWPKAPKEGDHFTHLDTISGADYVNYVFRDGRWVWLDPYGI